MTKKNILFAFLLLAMGIMVGCDKPAHQNNRIAYLLPKLRNVPLQSVELSSPEGKTVMSSREGIWYVDTPFNYPASSYTIETFLRSLSDAEIGKEIQISPSDYSALEVEKGGNGITARFMFSDDSEIIMIFGILDFPEDQSFAQVIGAGAIARRYVRIIGEDDHVYLTPLSMVDLTAAPSLWVDTTFIQIPSFKRLVVISEDTEKHELYREHMYGPLYHLGLDGHREKIDPNALAAFESLLASGYCSKIGKPVSSPDTFPDKSSHSILVEDFTGTAYTFHFGTPEEPGIEEVERASLQAGFLNDGIAPALIPFTVSFEDAELPLHAFAQARRKENLRLAGRFSNHILYAKLDQCAGLLQLLENE